ncbi:hypothetical protein JI739_14075 [Ramlibacter sp. AW1]|uniref:Lipoprotein n=1 Tax=Ramlibacter aurantiacus TaxID=2801330 RepID=A0A936ZS01_9BURK|nr:hypothetical protein [Ramlibacter aurantiacus]MBL0421481.1 hypothetical protein [Ramlibacter aurantiacus]
MKPIHLRTTLSLPCVLGLLAACGGGGGDSTGGDLVSADLRPQVAAEGYWSGRTVTQGWIDLIILEDGSTWGVLADPVQITGALQGRSSLDQGRFTAALTEFNFADATAPLITYGGTGTPQSRIDATGPGGRGWTVSYDPAYGGTASMRAIAGQYALDQRTVLSIGLDGAFNWVASADCTLAGSVVPRASGRNVFNLTATYAGLGCPHPDGSRVSGVAYLDMRTASPRLVSLALLDDGGVGFISRAVKLQDAQGEAPAPAPSPAPAPAPSPAPAPAPAPAPSPIPLPPIDLDDDDGGGGGGGGGRGRNRDRDRDDDD